MTRHHTNQSQWVIWKDFNYLSCYFGTCFPKQSWIYAYLTLGSSLFDRFKYILFVFFPEYPMCCCCLFVCFCRARRDWSFKDGKREWKLPLQSLEQLSLIMILIMATGFLRYKQNILCIRLTKHKEIRIFNLPALLEKNTHLQVIYKILFLKIWFSFSLYYNYSHSLCYYNNVCCQISIFFIFSLLSGGTLYSLWNAWVPWWWTAGKKAQAASS